MDLARARGAQPFDDAPRRRPAHDGVVDRDQSLAPDGAREGVQLEHDARLAQRLVGLDERAIDVTALHQGLAKRDAGRFRISDRRRGARVREGDHMSASTGASWASSWPMRIRASSSSQLLTMESGRAK